MLVKLPILKSPGKVPIAKSAITIMPIQKFPVPIAYICMANVKPQGRKNVSPQLMRSFTCFPNSVLGFFSLSRSVSFFANNFPVGRLNDIELSLGDMLVRFTPSKSITIPMINVITDITNGDTLITDQKIPRIPQRIPNPTILPTLNQR